MTRAELLWDDETIEHIWEGHHLRIEEVDEAFHDPKALTNTGRYARQVVYGRTEGGRYLTIVVEPGSRRVAWLITARPMTDSEKQRYRMRFK